MQGVIRLSDTLLLGPTSLGEFVPVPIRSIQRKRLPVTEVRGGQTASFALKKVCDLCTNGLIIQITYTYVPCDTV